MANEFIARNGIIARDNSEITGSLKVTAGVTASLAGTASWATNLVGGAGSTITIADEGTSQGTATFLNFTGNAVSVGAVSLNTASISIVTGSTVSTLAGTTNEVLVNGGTTAVAGAVTLSLPSLVDLGAASGLNATSVTASFISASGGLTGSLSASFLQGLINNSQLRNSSVTVGSTNIALGATSTTIAGLTSLSSTSLTGSITASSLQGLIINSQLANSSVTVGSTNISLGGTATSIAGLSSVSATDLTGSLTASSLKGDIILGTQTSGQYVGTVTQGTGVTVTGGTGENSTANIAIGQAVGTTSNVQFAYITASIVSASQFTGSFFGNGSGLTGVTATPTFPSTVKTDLATTDKFFINDDAGNSTTGNKQITYGNLVTDLAGSGQGTSNLTTTDSGDSLALTSIISGLSSVSATDLTGSLTASFLKGDIILGTQTSGDYLRTLTQGTGVTITSATGEGSNPTIAIGQVVGTTSDVTFGSVTSTRPFTGSLTASSLFGAINNSQLRNSSVTVTAGTGLSGGGTVALGGSITLNSTIVDTNTSYSLAADLVTNGARISLSGSDLVYDPVSILGSGATTVTRTDANTITISSTDTNTNTTYTLASDLVTGGARLTLSGSDLAYDPVAILGSGATTVTRTDANTITISSTDTNTNTTYTLAANLVSNGARLTLSGSDLAYDPVAILGSGATTVTRTDENTITISSTDNNTTYTLAADTASLGANISLSGSDLVFDAVRIAAGTGMGVVQTNTSTITLTNAGVTAITTNTGLSTNTSAVGAVTITNTDGGSSQAIFKNIAVSGQTTTTATANNDTLTFVNGTGVTHTLGTKTVTIAIGQAVATNSDVTFGSVTSTRPFTGSLTASSLFGDIRLGTQTSGPYVANLGTGTGVTIGSNTGEGSQPTITVNYGSTLNTAVQGNTSLAFAGTSGEITVDGGSSITLGAGGTVTYGLADTITGDRTFSGNITIGDSPADTHKFTGSFNLSGSAIFSDYKSISSAPATSLNPAVATLGVNSSGRIITLAPIYSSGSNNTGLGSNVLTNTSTGFGNTAIGVFALGNITTGFYNQGVGFTAGYFRQSGGDNTNTENCLFLGYDTRASDSGGTNEIIIGNQAVGIGSNSTVIGNSSTVRTYIAGRVLVGTGTDNGSSILQVSGSSIFTGSLLVNGTISATGEITAFGTTSDIRYKTNISPIQNSLVKINEISGVTFSWIENSSVHPYKGKDIGVIAQEIENVLPEAVFTKDNSIKTVRYEKIIPLLIEAIKEQQTEINELKNRLKNLENIK